jgi:hypothetical protein
MVYTPFHSNLDSLWLVLILILILILTSMSKSFKAADLLETWTQYFFYRLPHVTSWDWTSPYEICVIFVYLLLVSSKILPPPDSGIIVCCPEWSDIKYAWMPSCTYQNVLYLTLGFPIRRYPSLFLDVVMWKHEIFRCAKFTVLTPVSLLISCKLYFPIGTLKMSSMPTLTLKSTNKIFIRCLANSLNMF